MGDTEGREDPSIDGLHTGDGIRDDVSIDVIVMSTPGRPGEEETVFFTVRR
jgi:hypothetical protein